MDINEKLLEELLELKSRNKELEQKVADLEIERDALKNDLSVERHSRVEEKARYERIIASYEDGKALKQANADAEDYKERLIEQEGKLEQYIDKVEELESKLSDKPSEKNPFGAGRKRDNHLEVYLLGCWAKEMTDQEIIGSEYDGFDGKKKVARASYYRAKKRLIGKQEKGEMQNDDRR